MLKEDIDEEIEVGYRVAVVSRGGLSGSGTCITALGMRLFHAGGSGVLVKVEVDDIPRFPVFTVRLDDGKLIVDRECSFRGDTGVDAPPETDWVFCHDKRTFEVHHWDRHQMQEKGAKKYVGKYCRVRTVGWTLAGVVEESPVEGCLKVGGQSLSYESITEVKVYRKLPFFTKEEMRASDDHDAAYHRFIGQLVTGAVRRAVEQHIGIDRLLACTCKHLSEIPLIEWDRLAGVFAGPGWFQERCKLIGEVDSHSVRVSVLKEAARQLVAKHKAKVTGSQKFVEEKKAEGWTRSDFVEQFAKILGE